MTDKPEEPKMPVPYVYTENGVHYMRSAKDTRDIVIGEDYYNKWIAEGGREWKQ